MVPPDLSYGDHHLNPFRRCSIQVLDSCEPIMSKMKRQTSIISRKCCSNRKLKIILIMYYMPEVDFCEDTQPGH